MSRTGFSRHVTLRARRAALEARRAAAETVTPPQAPPLADTEPSLSSSDDDEEPEDLPPMPPRILEDQDGGDDDDDNNSSESSLSDSSSNSSDSDQEEHTDEAEETGQVPLGTLDGDVVFEIPFRDKLRSFGLSELQANRVVLNGATNPNAFARLFSKSAEHLNDLRILVVERVKMFHRWLNDRHGAGESLIGISLDGFTDQAMASLVEADSRGSVKRERDGASGKGTKLSLPTFNGVQSQYKVWNQKWRAYLGTMKNADGITKMLSECSQSGTPHGISRVESID